MAILGSKNRKLGFKNSDNSSKKGFKNLLLVFLHLELILRGLYKTWVLRYKHKNYTDPRYNNL